jgi:hypothetical protein
MNFLLLFAVSVWILLFGPYPNVHEGLDTDERSKNVMIILNFNINTKNLQVLLLLRLPLVLLPT